MTEWTEAEKTTFEPVFFIQQLLDWTQAYVMPGVLSLGLFGNTLSFVIFFRVRKRADACVQYLSCLAISDNMVILTIGVVDWVAFGLKYVSNGTYSFNLALYSSDTCRLVAGVWHVFEVISAWIIVAFSAERAYVVWFPLKRAYITPTVRKCIIFVISTSAVLLSLHRFILMELIPGTPALCFYKTNQIIAAALWQFDIAMYDYLPSICIFIANGLILSAISRSRKQKLGENVQNSRSEGRLLISLMSVSTLYVVLLLPLSTLFAYIAEARDTLGAERSLYLWYVMKYLTLVSVLNYCFNFIIYGCTLPFYRQEARKIFSFNWC